MNKDLKIAKSTVETEIKALKKLSASFNSSSQFSKAVSLISKTRGKVLVIGVGKSYIVGIKGMTTNDAFELLSELITWQTKPEFVYRHRWASNMLVLWDNRCLLHCATGGYEGYSRYLLRTTVADDVKWYNT